MVSIGRSRLAGKIGRDAFWSAPPSSALGAYRMRGGAFVVLREGYKTLERGTGNEKGATAPNEVSNSELRFFRVLAPHYESAATQARLANAKRAADSK